MANTALEMLLKIIFVLVLIFVGFKKSPFNTADFSQPKERKSLTPGL